MAKNRVYSLISILGLAVGIACALFISMYVYNELSFDQFHTKKDRIYRVVEKIDHNGEINAALTSVAVGPTLVQDYPEVENYVRFLSMGGGSAQTVTVGDKIFRESNFWFTDSTLFDVMSFPLVAGDPATALSGPRLCVLSEALAIKFFGSIDEAMGKDIEIGTGTFTVNGVIQNGPRNSDIVYDAFVSFSTIPVQSMQALEQDWFRLTAYTFVLFNAPIAPESFNTSLDEFSERYVTPYIEPISPSSSAEFRLQPLENLHFDNSREYDLPKGNRTYLSIFILLAVFILSIASINYINMSLSQSIKRAKEVGVRKSLGANATQVRSQFLGESFIICFLALVGGLVLVEVLLGAFNSITGKNFAFADVFSVQMVFTMLVLTLLVGLLSGFYPALVLSRFEASEVLRGSLPRIGKFGNLRRVLMVLQFGFSLLMIIGTLSIFSQMNYLQEKNLGFDKDQLVLINIPQDTAVFNHLASFKEELLKNPNVLGVTGSGQMPGGRVGELMFRIEQDGGQMQEKNIKFLGADEDFFPLLGLEIIKGRAFSSDIQSDIQQGFIINETAVKQFGWTENPIGKRMQWGLIDATSAANDGRVVGVVKDFHFSSLHNPMEPLAILFRPNFSLLFSVKLKGGDVKASLAYLEDQWSDFAGSHPFEFQFLDERVNSQYTEEQTLLRIFGYFSVLSILIASMGLFALTSFTVEQRLKEFSMRKVLGAKVADLARLLGKEFLVLLGIALLIVSPLAWYLLIDWLQNFSYRIDIPWFSFVLALVLTLCITVCTIGYHVFRLSRSNPARTLRME